MKSPIFLTRVVLNNYKSIKACSVKPGPLTFLVGPNGAGKSNFLDALRLITESINTSLEHALRERGGINEVRRRSPGHPTHFGMRLEWQLPNGMCGMYAFRVGSQTRGGFEIQQEECRVFEQNKMQENSFKVETGILKKSSFEIAPPASRDRLYLVAAAGLPAFRPLYDALSHMGFYNFNPDVIRDLQAPDPGDVLKRDGSNLASVLSVLEKEREYSHDRIIDLLSKVVPGIKGVEIKPVGKKTMLEFRQQVGTNKDPWRFPAENMSDGTLRALGVLTALFQSSNSNAPSVPFVGIEEPEIAVHPGAAGVLRDGLRLASENTQIAVTSHSPDLLDDKDIPENSILSVINLNGETIIGPLDEASRSAIRDRLYTAGELMRNNQLALDETMIASIPNGQMDLFAEYQP